MAQVEAWHNPGLGRWRRHMIPIFVWVTAVAASVWLFAYRSSSAELAGIASPEQREVSAVANGRLRLVSVEVLTPVKQGQTLAVLEDESIQASLATALAEASRLRAELAAMENQLAVDAAVQQSEQMAEARQYAVDVEKNRLHEIELQVAMEANRARLEFLRLQKDLLSRLRTEQAVSELKFRSAEADCKAMEKNMEESQKALTQARKDLQQASRRQEAFAKNHVEPRTVNTALEPLRAAVTVQERKINELSLEQSMRVLKSPIDGVVSSLRRGAGEAVRTGEPILTVVATHPLAVMAYASAAQLSRFDAGKPVRLHVSRDGGRGQTLDAKVQTVGPAAEQIPARLWRSPNVPEWGWPVRIVIPANARIFSGELVGVSGR